MIREEARKACERLVRADAAMNSVEEAEELSRKKASCETWSPRLRPWQSAVACYGREAFRYLSLLT